MTVLSAFYSTGYLRLSIILVKHGAAGKNSVGKRKHDMLIVLL